MIKSDNRISLCLGIPGIILRLFLLPVIQYWVKHPHDTMPVEFTFYFMLWTIGTVLLLFGLAYHAKAKGHSMAWGLMGFLGIIGLIVLACLPDRLVRVTPVTQVQNDTGMTSQTVATTAPVRSKTSGFAVASLVLGIMGIFPCFIPLSIIGLILAILALNKIRKYPATVGGKGMAIAGLVLSCIGIISFISMFLLIILNPPQ